MNVPNNNQNRSSFNNSNVMPNGPMMDDTNMFGPNQNCPFGGNQNMPNGMGFPGNNTQRMDQNGPFNNNNFNNQGNQNM